VNSNRAKAIPISTPLAKRWLIALTTCALVAAALTIFAPRAEAQNAYIAHRTNLRAGPDGGYPAVGWVGRGTSVYVNGCVRGYYWCDVSVGGMRGWASARHISYLYGDRNVVVYGNGLAFGAPVVGFTVGSYWDSYYRDRPWYHHHGYWSGWRPGVAVQPHYYRGPSVYVAPQAAYVPARPVYVAPRPAYVAPAYPHVYSHPNPHRVHRHEAHIRRDERRAIREQHREQVRAQHHRSAPPAVVGMPR
jgi:uncharacterized protein YraI